MFARFVVNQKTKQNKNYSELLLVAVLFKYDLCWFQFQFFILLYANIRHSHDLLRSFDSESL